MRPSSDRDSLSLSDRATWQPTDRCRCSKLPYPPGSGWAWHNVAGQSGNGIDGHDLLDDKRPVEPASPVASAESVSVGLYRTLDLFVLYHDDEAETAVTGSLFRATLRLDVLEVLEALPDSLLFGFPWFVCLCFGIAFPVTGS